MADGEAPARKSDLGVRTVSAIVMLAVAGGAIALGGPVWAALVVAVGFVVIWEFGRLVRMAGFGQVQQVSWALFAVIYIVASCLSLIWLREADIRLALLVVGLVIATDIGAYFAGRTIGGPKIAPAISPSKTWAGLGGGMLLAAVFTAVFQKLALADVAVLEGFYFEIVALAAALAIVAQAGDFLESWLKRKAGVKDSGNIIPGHGGLFDRVDGLLAVLFVLGLSQLVILATVGG